MNALQVVTNLALEKTRPLAVYQSDLSTLNLLMHIYGDAYSLYDHVMDDVRGTLAATPVAERKRAYHDSWHISVDTVASYGSDTVIDDMLYVTDGVFSGNLSIGDGRTLIIPKEKMVVIDGNVLLLNSTSLVNNGNLTATGYVRSYNNGYGSTVHNNGNLTVCGEVNVDNIYMSDSDTVLTIGGNIYFYGYSDITDGTVILNGTVQQEIRGLSCHNLEVTNKAGIRYSSAVCVTGHYRLNGNPLDNMGYYTYAESADVLFDSISDYKDIYVNCDLEIPNSVKGNIIIGDSKTLTIPEGKTVVVDGYILYSSSTTLVNNGNLTVTGYVRSYSYGYGSTVHNNGNLTVCGEVNVDNIYMSDSDTVLTIGGNIYFYGYSNITDGTVILNGTEKQTIRGLSNIPVLIIENISEDGVVLESCINSTVLFNHKGNNFTLYGGGSGSTFADFDGDKLTDEKDDDPTAFDSKYYCETLCDITGDGKTNIIDLIRMKKNISNSTNSDVNLDGEANIYDMTFVRKVLIGIYEILSPRVISQ